MHRIRNQKHNKETFLYSFSSMMERASYYGLRILLMLYMTGEVMNMDRTEVLTILGLFSGSLIVSKIIGALLGDLILGNRKAIIIGGIIQALGAFVLCISSTTALYLGLFLVVLGNGFYSPNIISNFGKLYLRKTKLLDSGFTLYYFAVSLGSFLGILLIGTSAEKHGYPTGFILSGILMLISILPIILSKHKFTNEKSKNDFSLSKRIINIAIALVLVGLFWAVYEISSIRTLELQLEFWEILSGTIPKSLFQFINFNLTLVISIIAVIAWTYFYSSQFFKLMMGFIFGAISFGILFLIPEIPSEQHTILYFLSVLLLGISEIHIAPVLFSVLTKYSNPKYLAILISLTFIPSTLISLAFGIFKEEFYLNPSLALTFGVVAMSTLGIGLLGYLLWDKKSAHNNKASV